MHFCVTVISAAVHVYLAITVLHHQQYRRVLVISHVPVQSMQTESMFECAVDWIPVVTHGTADQVGHQLLEEDS